MTGTDHTEQLAAFDRWSAAAVAGRGQVVLVRAALLHGKTALLRQVAHRARDAGFRTVAAACCPDPDDASPALLEQLLQAAADVEGPAAEPLPAELPTRLLDAVRALARCGPVLLAIDAVQHADEASLPGLVSVLRRTRRLPVLAVLTMTPPPWPRRPHRYRTVAGLPGSHRVDLLPLGPVEVAQVFAGRPPDAYAVTGGNPGMVGALAADLARGETCPGAHYRQAVADGIAGAGAAVADVAGGLAVLAPWSGPDVLADLLARPRAAVGDAITLLERSGLTDGAVLRHPAVEQAVLGALPAAHRERLHRRAAQLGHDARRPDDEVARHLVAAGPPAGDWAVDALVAAAEHATADDDVPFAVDCLLLARHLRPAHVVAVARLADAEWQLDPAVGDRHGAALLAASRADLLPARDAFALVRRLLWHGHVGDAVDVLDRLGDQLRDRGCPRTEAELQDTLTWATALFPALPARSGPTPATSGPQPPRGDPWLQAAAALAGVLHGDHRRPAPDAERFLRRLSPKSAWSEEAAALAVSVLVATDRLRPAESACARLLEDATRRGLTSRRAAFGALGAEIALRQGDLAAAAERAADALALLPARSWGVGIGSPVATLVLAETARGRFAEADRQIDRPVPDALLDSRHALPYLWARGRHHLLAERHHAALADFLACGELQRDWGVETSTTVPWRAGAAEAWTRLGNQSRARRLVFEQLARTPADAHRVRGWSLRVLAATEPPHRRGPLLAETVDAFERCGDRYELACALAELGRNQQARGHHPRARMTIRRSWHLAMACGAAPLCAELLPELHPADRSPPATASPTGVADLTGSERRVAALAVAGHTNREIALKLFITQSTVEQHLTRVFRKLRIHRRHDLPIDLHTDLADSA